MTANDIMQVILYLFALFAVGFISYTTGRSDRKSSQRNYDYLHGKIEERISIIADAIEKTQRDIDSINYQIELLRKYPTQGSE